jgi:hypothetical protein
MSQSKYSFYRYIPHSRSGIGLAVTLAVSRPLLTALARVHSHRSVYVGFAVGRVGTGAGFVRVLRFLLSILLAKEVPIISNCICDCYSAMYTAFVSIGSVSHLPKNKDLRLARFD